MRFKSAYPSVLDRMAPLVQRLFEPLPHFFWASRRQLLRATDGITSVHDSSHWQLG
jgi:hypothetical protein